MEDYWHDPSPQKRDEVRRKLFTPEGIRNEFLDSGNLPPDIAEMIDPAIISLGWSQVSRPEVVEALLDLHLDYRTNVALYAAFQSYFRQYQPPALIIWGRHDQYGTPEAAEAYKRDLPNAEIRIVEGGHWALESNGSEVVGLAREFLERSYKANLNSRSADAVPAFTVKAADNRIGRKLNILGEEFSVKISSRDTNGAFTVLENFVPPMSGPPLHRHLRQDEWFYIVEGQFLFEADGKKIQAGPGETVFLRQGTRHTLQNVGVTAGRAVVTVVPGGLDLFFEELSATLPLSVQPDPAKLAGLFKKHGLELLGPPLSTRKAA